MNYLYDYNLFDVFAQSYPLISPVHDYIIQLHKVENYIEFWERLTHSTTHQKGRNALQNQNTNFTWCVVDYWRLTNHL